MRPPPTQRSPLLGQIDPVASHQVEDLFRNAIPRIRTRLVNRVGMDLPVGPASIEWSPLGPILDRLSGSALVRFQIEPSGLVGLFAVDTDLLTMLVGQILGQPQDRTWAGREGRAPSRFDMVVAKHLAEDVLGGIVELLPPDVGQSVTTDAAAAQRGIGLPRTAFVGAAQYTVTIATQGGDTLKANIVVVLPSEITRLAAPRRTAVRTENRVGLDRIMPLPVIAVAELRRITMLFSALREIRPGHVIDLGPAKEVVISVGDRPALVGEAGVQNQMRSVRIRARTEGGIVSSRR